MNHFLRAGRLFGLQKSAVKKKGMHPNTVESVQLKATKMPMMTRAEPMNSSLKMNLIAMMEPSPAFMHFLKRLPMK